MHSVILDGIKLATKVSLNDLSNGLSFFTQDSDFLQLGGWRYDLGKQLAAHNHKIVERSVDRTQEVIVVLKGKVLASIYDEEDQLIEKVEVVSSECLILFSGGHGYEILEDDTVVFEVKNGPYVGADVDRRRLK